MESKQLGSHIRILNAYKKTKHGPGEPLQSKALTEAIEAKMKKERKEINPMGLTINEQEEIRYRSLDVYEDQKRWYWKVRYCRVTFRHTSITYDENGNIKLTEAEKIALKHDPDYFTMPEDIKKREDQRKANAILKHKQRNEAEMEECRQWDKLPVWKRWGQIQHAPPPEDGKAIHIFVELDNYSCLFAYTYYNGNVLTDPEAFPYDHTQAKISMLMNNGCDVFVYQDGEVRRYNHGSRK